MLNTSIESHYRMTQTLWFWKSFVRFENELESTPWRYCKFFRTKNWDPYTTYLSFYEYSSHEFMFCISLMDGLPGTISNYLLELSLNIPSASTITVITSLNIFHIRLISISRSSYFIFFHFLCSQSCHYLELTLRIKNIYFCSYHVVLARSICFYCSTNYYCHISHNMDNIVT